MFIWIHTSFSALKIHSVMFCMSLAFTDSGFETSLFEFRFFPVYKYKSLYKGMSLTSDFSCNAVSWFVARIEEEFFLIRPYGGAPIENGRQADLQSILRFVKNSLERDWNCTHFLQQTEGTKRVDPKKPKIKKKCRVITLGKPTVSRRVEKVPEFMSLESPLPCSEEAVTGASAKPYETSPRPPVLFKVQ
jgi:hypothetical protein